MQIPKLLGVSKIALCNIVAFAALCAKVPDVMILPLISSMLISSMTEQGHLEIVCKRRISLCICLHPAGRLLLVLTVAALEVLGDTNETPQIQHILHAVYVQHGLCLSNLPAIAAAVV